MAKRGLSIAEGAALAVVLCASPALAAEGGSSFYLLGSKTTMGGYLPPVGVYGVVQNYFYTGSADIDFETAGVSLSGGIDADAYVALPTVLWVTGAEVFGGNLAFTLTTPLGGKRLNVGVLTGNGVELDAERDNFAFGDPVLGATVGWHEGNFHYTIGSLINVPIGQWELGNPINMGFNRWMVDTTAAVTYLNPQTGLELSGAFGITYNFENPDTNYKSGTELHFEAAVMQHFSHTFSLGVNGYAYKQITGDSGSGAVLGDFKGQVLAIGPALDYTFLLGKTPVTTNFRYFYEFNVENRLQGHAGFLNVVIPLGGQAPQASSH
ncbi:transporter [Aquibium carbonis]|uniref:Transporter n=1 Tax=Aquibium carbonis TaxID=2495581 RepID=A0A429Z0Z8_9HYPH|nr:transporter [Aquibium carbonis]RST87406.1 transporter [Aquibium carbonis]